MVTDASGLFDFTALPEGRYNLSVSKTGFVTLAYGQRRPLQPGTPLQLGSGQRLQGIEMRLPRGSAISGHVLDENGEPLPNTMVRVLRYQYQQGERRLTPAGAGQTDDRGQYRVWGLNPGDYYVSAVMPNLGNLLDQLGGRGGGPGGRGGQGGPAGQGPGGRGGRGAAGQAGDPNQAAGGRGRGGQFGADAFGADVQAIAGAGGAAGLRGLIGTVISDPGLGDALVAAGLPNVATMFGSPLDGNLEAIAYAPTYYPGVSSPNEARAVTVGLGAEALGIDFNLLLVRTSRISGRVTNPDGTPVPNGNVNLSLEASSGRGGGGGPAGGAFGESFGSRIQADGSFSIANVPPGRYTLRARSSPPGRGGGGGGGGGGRGAARGAAAAGGVGAAAGAAEAALPQFASQLLNVGGDVTDLMITLAPGATISGSIMLQTTGGLPNLNQIRITAQATDSALGTNINTQVQPDGTFTLQGVPGGTHWIRGQAPRGLMLKAVTAGGRDVIDEPYEVRSGEKIDNLSLVFTDRVAEINGTITDDRGTPVTDYTVLVYPEDARLWRPQSRQIMTSRPDQNGKFQVRGLPPGRYYVATVDPAVAGEWFEPAFLEQHRDTAARLTLMEGEVKTQDFKMR
jgi:protocatechuate 3,4-dioxygenase beta subunit